MKRKNPEINTKIKPFINKYKWEGKNVPSKKDDWRKFEKNNMTIALNVLHAKKSILYIQNSSIREKQVIFSMITNGEEWFYLALKNYQSY